MCRVHIVVAIKAFCGGRTMIEAIEVSRDESGYKTLKLRDCVGEPNIAYHERVGLVFRLEAGSHKFDSGVIRTQWVGSKCQALSY